MQSAEEKKQEPQPREDAEATLTGQSPGGSTGEPSPEVLAQTAAGVQPPPSDAKPGAKSALRETLETVLVALLVALVIRSFLVQLYVVDGESMFPTLHHGDRLLVNKIGYRFGQPEVGEIVVLEDPQDPRRQLIKRVIAVAGETVEVRNRTVFVNGQALKEESYTNPHTVHFLDMPPQPVPEGYLFVMGDNRGGSLDSRMLGPIPVSKVEGKAFFLFWPLNRMKNHGPLDASRTYK